MRPLRILPHAPVERGDALALMNLDALSQAAGNLTPADFERARREDVYGFHMLATLSLLIIGFLFLCDSAAMAPTLAPVRLHRPARRLPS